MSKGCDLVVYPELNISSYAVDDLLLQEAFLDAVEEGIAELRERPRSSSPVLVIGAPLRRNGRLYNCALAISRGRILGVVPKSFLPNYREYYEKRWFVSGHRPERPRHRGGGRDRAVRNRPDLRRRATSTTSSSMSRFARIIGRRSRPRPWARSPGALILCNLSASNITIGKADERKMLCASQARAAAAPPMSTPRRGRARAPPTSPGTARARSTSWANCSAESEPLRPRARARASPISTSSGFGSSGCGCRPSTTMPSPPAIPRRSVRRIRFEHKPSLADIGFERRLRRFPFVPNRPEQLDQDCYEAFNIQVQGLAKRFTTTSGKHLVIGVSGGLDSTHALIVAAKVCDFLGLPRSTILGFTMPGFATGDDDQRQCLGADEGARRGRRGDRHPAGGDADAQGHGPPLSRSGEPVYDITFENVQAGLRTDYLFRLANQRSGFVIGTGDLSELALGWCTYGVGDHMSHYGVNAGVPKTLIQYLIRWAVKTDQFDAETDRILTAILDTKISPELVPADAEGGDAEHRGYDRPLRAARFLPVPHPAPGPAAVARSPSSPGRPGTMSRPGQWPLGYPEHSSAPTICRRSASGWRSSSSASSRPASSSARPCPTRPRFRRAAASARAATGARRPTAPPSRGSTN